MFFPRKWKVRRLSRPIRTILLAGGLLAGSATWLMSEGAAPTSSSPPRAKDRSSRRAETKIKREKEKAESSEDSDLERPLQTPEMSKSSPPLIAIKTEDRLLKPGAIREQIQHPLGSAIELVEISQEKLSSVRDYSATFLKREAIKGKIVEQSLEIKVRETPFSVALKFNNPYRGRQVIYVEGLNEGKMLVKPEGFKSIVGTLSFAPDGPEALAENRHPITQAGLSSMLRLTLAQWKSETKFSDIHDIQITEAKQASGDICHRIQVKREKNLPGIPFQMTNLYLSKSTQLPTRIEHYDWPKNGEKLAPLAEEYSFHDLKTNIGLTDKDFR